MFEDIRITQNHGYRLIRKQTYLLSHNYKLNGFEKKGIEKLYLECWYLSANTQT